MSNRQLRLGAFIMATGHHIAAWRHPGSQIDSGTNIDHYIEVAQTAERGLFRTAYEGSTLRENLGLERPVSRYAAAARLAA